MSRPLLQSGQIAACEEAGEAQSRHKVSMRVHAMFWIKNQIEMPVVNKS